MNPNTKEYLNRLDEWEEYYDQQERRQSTAILSFTEWQVKTYGNEVGRD
jgi:hypothetical protein